MTDPAVGAEPSAIRFATVGTGAITERFLDACAGLAGVRVECVHSRDLGRARGLAERYDIPSVGNDLTEVLGRPDIDAVYLASPNSLHHAQALAAIRAGKHVLIEKPAVPSAAHWQQLVDAARPAGVVVLEAMRTAHDPGLPALLDVLPELGTIRRASFRYQKRSARYDAYLGGRSATTFDPAMGGGALMDLGVYCAHVATALFGTPAQVTGSAVLLASGIDGAGAALLAYPGLLVDLDYSKITTSLLPSEIQGEDATLLIDHVSSPRRLTVRYRDGTIREQQISHPQHCLEPEIRRFAELVASGADADHDQRRTLQTLTVLDRIRAGLTGP